MLLFDEYVLSCTELVWNECRMIPIFWNLSVKIDKKVLMLWISVYSVFQIILLQGIQVCLKHTPPASRIILNIITTKWVLICQYQNCHACFDRCPSEYFPQRVRLKYTPPASKILLNIITTIWVLICQYQNCHACCDRCPSEYFPQRA